MNLFKQLFFFVATPNRLGLMLVLLTLITLAESPASSKSYEELFRDGVKNYQDKKYDSAKLSFSEALTSNPKSISAMTNLALTYYQLGEKGWALALLRKAKKLNSDFTTATDALEFITPQLEIKEIPHEIQYTETAHQLIFDRIPTWFFSITAAVFIFLFFWLLFSFFGKRKRAALEGISAPSLSFSLILSFFIFIFSSFFFIFKIFDSHIARATVVQVKLEVLSMPNEKAPSLFELHQGLEVVVNQAQNGWAQVTYPGGSTGWVPEKSIFITSEGL